MGVYEAQVYLIKCDVCGATQREIVGSRHWDCNRIHKEKFPDWHYLPVKRIVKYDYCSGPKVMFVNKLHCPNCQLTYVPIEEQEPER
jgi:hypothetical protein